jgi:hypothetical protein
VLTSNGTAWVSQAISAGGDYIMTAYTSPATWTKPAGLKAVKITVIGAGGNGGNGTDGPNYTVNRGGNGGGGGAAIEYIDAPAIPGPVSVTVGSAPSKTSSFGPFLSATGGTNGTNTPNSSPAPGGPYAGGVGSGGTVNFTGGYGFGNATPSERFAGAAALGFSTTVQSPGTSFTNGVNGVLYGGGASGAVSGPQGTRTGGTGAAGIVIVEEFY